MMETRDCVFVMESTTFDDLYVCESVSAVCMCRSLEASFNEASEFFASYELQVHVVKFVYLLYGNDDGKN